MFATVHSRTLLSSCQLSKNVKIGIYKTNFACGCETSLTLREEYRLRVFENRVQKGIFGLRRDNEELLNLYCLPSIIRMLVNGGDMSRAISINQEEECL
jgi:hypothetical protein